MKIYISIDGGTTNTRVALVEDRKVLESRKIAIGSKMCIGGNGALKSEIKKAINDLLSVHGLKESDVCAILASGMITCEYGLYELKHISAPAGVKELHDGMKRVEISEISDIPFYFIPGVKTNAESFVDADVMRGEETELMGLMGDDANCVYVLPGSHNKVIYVNDENKIEKFETLLTGEMIAALSQNTILSASVDLGVKEYDRAFLRAGYEAAGRLGVNSALFKTRLLGTLYGGSKEQIYGYFLGVTLANEVDSIKRSGKCRAVIGGKSQLKRALSDLLSDCTDVEAVCVPDGDVDNSVPMGQITVFEY